MILRLIDGPSDNKVQRCIIHQVIETKRLDVSMSPEERRERHGGDHEVSRGEEGHKKERNPTF